VLPRSLVLPLLSAAMHRGAPAARDLASGAEDGADPKRYGLSSREVQILTYLMDGASNKVIARKLDVAEATVKVHVKAILRKLGAANRTQAAMWATGRLAIRA